MFQFEVPLICTEDWMREVAKYSVQEDVHTILALTRGSGKTIFALKYANWLVQNFPGIRVLVRTKNLKRDEVINILCHECRDFSSRDIYTYDPVLRFVHRRRQNIDTSLDVVCSEDTTVLRGHRYNVMFHDDCEIDDVLQPCIYDLRAWWTSDPKIILTGKHIILKDGDDYCDRVYSIRRNPYVQLSEPELRELSIVL